MHILRQLDGLRQIIGLIRIGPEEQVRRFALHGLHNREVALRVKPKLDIDRFVAIRCGVCRLAVRFLRAGRADEIRQLQLRIRGRVPQLRQIALLGRAD
ncbi:hypothetical protein PMJ11TS3_53570 [Paenibacillus melissococcoides]